ncbi:hypothetical protein [Psychrobacillus sp. FSL K6-1415]|uniref:hypothetical protein n=1 Tax=Psychrobacillus sp. FSL K6-1415 TaxID=2921544 RepID=UPI0030F4CB55
MVYNESRRLNKTLKFKKEAENVKIKLESEINAHKLGRGSDGTINQLENIYKEIELMIESLNYIPSYPRVIVDTWDYSSELGKQLLDIYEIYKTLG